MAENFKHQGNACFAAGKAKYKDAIAFYTKGIECKIEDELLGSILHSNRAAVNLELSMSMSICIVLTLSWVENYRSVLYDCARAIKMNHKNIKAYFRSAKALLALDKVDEAIDCCQKGLLLDPTNTSLPSIINAAQERGKTLQELIRLQSIKNDAREKEANALKAALEARNYKSITEKENDNQEEEYSIQHPDASTYKITLYPDGELSYPVIFLYPEFNQSDVISCFMENDTFYSHFVAMFEQQAPWDEKHLYHPQTLDWYFETHAERYSKENKELVSCLKTVQVASSPSQTAVHRYAYMTLADVLRSARHTIVNGVVKIIVFSQSSPQFALRFKKEHKRINK